MARQRALAAQLHKAIAAGLRVTALLAAMAILMALQTPLVAVAVGLAARARRHLFRPTQQAVRVALRIQAPSAGQRLPTPVAVVVVQIILPLLD